MPPSYRLCLPHTDNASLLQTTWSVHWCLILDQRLPTKPSPQSVYRHPISPLAYMSKCHIAAPFGLFYHTVHYVLAQSAHIITQALYELYFYNKSSPHMLHKKPHQSVTLSVWCLHENVFQVLTITSQLIFQSPYIHVYILHLVKILSYMPDTLSRGSGMVGPMNLA